MDLYRTFTSQEQIDSEYNPRVLVGDEWASRYLVSFAEWGLQTFESDHRTRHSYGKSTDEYVDIYATSPKAPVHIFFHGGYWKANHASDYGYVAEQLNALGFTAAIVNYSLCPQVTVSDIIEQCRAAVAWIWRNIDHLGGDRQRLSISGHSAGGHVVGMMLSTDWMKLGIPVSPFRFALPISGLFDLGPFPHSWLQSDIRLSDTEVETLSPVTLTPTTTAPVCVTVGEYESSEFYRQSIDYWKMLRAAGVTAEFRAVEGRTHFDSLEAFERGGTLASVLGECG